LKRIGITTYRNTARVRRVWAEITHNPRVSLRELGTITGMPMTTVVYSIRKLTEAGYIAHDKAIARSFRVIIPLYEVR
jgi:predicted transcriptional regulator